MTCCCVQLPGLLLRAQAHTSLTIPLTFTSIFMFAVKRMSYFSPGYCKRATSNYCNCTKRLFFFYLEMDFKMGFGDYTISLPKLGSHWQTSLLLWICRRSVHFDVLQNYVSSALPFPSCMNRFFTFFFYSVPLGARWKISRQEEVS